MLVLRERGVCLDSSLVFVLLLLLGGAEGRTYFGSIFDEKFGFHSLRMRLLFVPLILGNKFDAKMSIFSVF